MNDNEAIIEPDKDCRKQYASGVVAVLEKFAAKHNMFIGKKEWVRHDTWTDLNGIHKVDCLYLDAIVFTGLISKINNLEYVIIYDSNVSKLEFGLVIPEFRKTYADAPKWGIALYQSGDDGTHDLMFGKEYRGFFKERSEISNQYNDFRRLVETSYSCAGNVEMEALELVMEAFRHVEEKHVRRMKNEDSLAKKEQRLKESESKHQTILDVIKDKFGDVDITQSSPTFYPRSPYPICVRICISSSTFSELIVSHISYTAKRDTFHLYMRAEPTAVLGSESSVWELDGDLNRIVEAIRYAIEFCRVYSEASDKIVALRKQYSMEGACCKGEDED